MEQDILTHNILVKLDEQISFTACLPDWFFVNRGENGITFADQYNSKHYINLPNFYKRLYYFLKDKKHLTYVDVGANIGLSTIPLAISGHKVISIEPLISNLQILENNKKLNACSFEMLPYAIGDTEEETVIFTGDETDCASLILQSVEAVNKLKSERTQQITTKRLDSLLTTTNQYFLKIDVQGYEMNVLRSCENLFKHNCAPYILIEMEDRFLQFNNSSVEQIHNFLSNYGYSKQEFWADDILYTKQ